MYALGFGDLGYEGYLCMPWYMGIWDMKGIYVCTGIYGDLGYEGYLCVHWDMGIWDMNDTCMCSGIWGYGI